MTRRKPGRGSEIGLTWYMAMCARNCSTLMPRECVVFATFSSRFAYRKLRKQLLQSMVHPSFLPRNNRPCPHTLSPSSASSPQGTTSKPAAREWPRQVGLWPQIGRRNVLSTVVIGSAGGKRRLAIGRHHKPLVTSGLDAVPTNFFVSHLILG